MPQDLIVGDRDPDLDQRLDQELDKFNFATTGVSHQSHFSVKAVDGGGDLVGGLTAWTWGGLCGISMLWVREDSRKDGWGAKLLAECEAEALRRGCDRVAVSSFTFQAPHFYQKYGYAETGRTLGIPGGYEDVHMFKRLTEGDGPFVD
jgi:GNAT superfamily N-acetyltransferase